MEKSLRHRIGIVAATAFAMCSCSHEQERSTFCNVGPDGWLYGDTVELAPLADADTASLAIRDIAVAIRHTNRYEYSNIWLELTYAAPDTIHVDTINMQLADRYGRWLGKGVGVGFQRVDTVAASAHIDLAKPVWLRHIMRADTLGGIEQAAIVVL